jgi:hypothetical protein
MAEGGAARVLEVLSEEECYLWAILQDRSGLDQAEFLWYDPSKDDGCFRAWAFQWKWWRNREALQIDQCARSVGKSLSIKARGCAFPLLFPGQEMVITAPELVHLEPIVGLIEQQIQATRLTRELLPRSRSAINHRPFMMHFSNGARIIGRIPQRDGKGVKGIHPIWLELDEAQDYPEQGWTELTETLKRGFEGATWRAHGVTRGIRDDFYEKTQDSPDNDWQVHRYAAMYRPNWTDEERQEKIKQYGSREDPDYRRNILGEHGDSTNPIFVLHRLMACVDDQETSDYNANEYFVSKVKAEHIQKTGQSIVEMMDFPARHKTYVGPDPKRPRATFWCGMDVGYTIDPSEILVFVEYREKPKDEYSKLKLISRVQLTRMGIGDQTEAIKWVIDAYRPKVFAMDKGGNGLPLFQNVQELAENDPKQFGYIRDAIKGYNFSEKRVVDFDQEALENLSEYADLDEQVKEAGIKRSVLEYATDTLRVLVDSKRLELPWDADLLKQFQGGTWTPAKGLQDQYGRRLYSKGNDHILDAARFAVLGWKQYGIEEILKKPQDAEAILDVFVAI